MDFSPDENARAVADLAADVLRNESGEPADSSRYDESAWDALAKVGLLSVTLPEDNGGDGLGAAELAALLTEVGTRGVYVPALATLGLGVPALVSNGTVAQRAALLPEVGAGNVVLTGAPSEPAAPLTRAPRCKAARDGGTWRLDGVKAAVPYAQQAQRILVPASTPDGVGVFLADPEADGVTLNSTPSSTGQPEYTVRLDGAAAELLGDDLSGVVAVTLRDYARASALAQGSGALAGALELTTTHLRTRHQFGKPLATFQAVAQQVADVYIAARIVRLATTSAIWRLATGRDAAADLDIAAYWFAEQALPALRTCHHLHGGLGVDVTYPLHRYYSMIKDLTRFLGGPAHLLGIRAEAEGS